MSMWQWCLQVMAIAPSEPVLQFELLVVGVESQGDLADKFYRLIAGPRLHEWTGPNVSVESS